MAFYYRQVKGLGYSLDSMKLGIHQYLKRKAAELRCKPTRAEVIFERKLIELGIKYQTQYIFYSTDTAGICDFYLSEHKVLIEIDGGYHLEQDQQHKDRVKDFICATQLNKPVLRLTNKQAMYLSIEQTKTLLEDLIEKAKQALPVTMKLKGWKHGKRCKCKRLGKHIVKDMIYCKRCFKRLQRQNMLAKKGLS